MVSQLLFDGMYNLLSLDHDAKHYVLAVQTRRGPGRYEKLTSIRVWTCAEDRKKRYSAAIYVEH